ncbi:MAG: methyltransferase domain-containing protein [Fuerstiella sp.]
MLTDKIQKVVATAADQTIKLYESTSRAKADTARQYISTHAARYVHDIREVTGRLKPGDHVLDLGAAPFCTSLVFHELGFRVTAADFRPYDWIDPRHLPFAVAQVDCDGAKFPFEDQSFSAVVLTEVFEHLHVNLNFTIKEILRILKPSGFLYMTTPNLTGVRSLLRLYRRGKLTGDVYETWRGAEEGGCLGHVREYTAREIGEYLPKCGFSDVEVFTRNVYRKQWLETNFWKLATLLFRQGRETIVAVARRAA